MPKVVIFSSPDDPHAHAVLRSLNTRPNFQTELLDLTEYPTQLALTIRLSGADSDQVSRSATLTHRSGATLDLHSVAAFWWRRPGEFKLHPELTQDIHRAFALSEMQTAFEGLYLSLDAFWINRPHADRVANHKLYQLSLARQLGLTIPRTLITSDPIVARAFASENPGAVIYKQFRALPNCWRETRLLAPEETALIDSVRFTPVLFQRFVPAVADLRVTIIGQRIFAASNLVRPTDYQADVRMNFDTTYVSHQLPSSVEIQLHALMAHLGLEYGAIDLRLTPEGEYVFLEINPAGQFLYIEQHTGQPIAQALADRLAEAASAD